MSFPAYPDYKDSGVPWLGAVPGHWERKPLFALAKELDERNHGMREDNLLSLSYGKIKRKNIEDNDGLLPASFETYQIVERDDIVWRLTDLQNDQRSLRTGIVRERGIITSAYLATRPIAALPEFLAYLLRAYDLTKVFYSMGGGLRQSMKFSDVKWLPIMLPSVGEQAAIAAFLDRETAKIDALVAEQERLIALLKEKRQAVISLAVTKGLNPHAPMKDSGIEWLGEIPAHWGVVPLKYLSTVGNGSTPKKDDMRFWEGGAFPWLNSSVVNMEVVTSSENFVTETALKECHLPVISPPAILMAITGQGKTRGMVAALACEATVSQHVAYIKPDQARLRVDFALRFLESQYRVLRSDSEGAGSTKGAITCEQIARLFIALPPVAEQAAIAEHLGYVVLKFSMLESEAKAAITLLQERRAALISGAVTGKIDVRGEAISSNVVALESARPARASPALSAIVGTYAIRELGPMGRMAVMKAGYLAEAYAGLSDLNGRYERYAAGPYDRVLLTAMERGASELSGIITHEPRSAGDAVTYQVPSTATAPSDALRITVGEEAAERFRSMLLLLKGIGRDGVEAVATIYAVWNDLLADKKDASDEMICRGVLTDWHPEKANKFKRSDLDHWLGWMRRHGFAPDGTAPRTDHQGSLF